MKKTFHVIAHTHWDFEWYFSTHESLIQLIYHMEEVMSSLESGETDSYLLDGQLSIVEDYLEQCPEQTQRFTALVESGKLVIGPWYTQTDQLIIGGESIVRNLACGIRLGEKYGRVMKIGYVPDSFGQSIDMPKIYRGVGIDKTVFWRGLCSDLCASREFNWSCEDGSRVLAYNIKNGYFTGSYIIDFDDPASLCELSAEGTLANHVAVPLGGDQRYIDTNIKSRIALCNHNNADYFLKESSYQQLFEAIQAEELDLPEIRGEMIDGQVSKIHRSIYSSRYDHKYLNDRIERRLSYQLEPLMVMAGSLGIASKPCLLGNIWKVIMRNHAHDSAGGCNTDKTNKIIAARYEQADQMSGSAVDYLVRKIAESQQGGIDGRLTIFNTLPYAREQVVNVNISTQSQYFLLTDSDGKQIEFDCLKSEKCYRGTIQKDAADNDPDKYYYQSDIEFIYPLGASSFVSLQVTELDKPVQESIMPLTAECREAQIGNAHYQLTCKDGQFTLLDKCQQRCWPDCIALHNMGDDGDTYDYSPPEHDWLLALNWSQARVSVTKGSQSQTLFVEGEWALPKDLAARRNKELNGNITYKLAFRLQSEGASQQGCPLLIEAEFDNQVLDHRMQLVVTAPISTRTSWADTPFGTVERVNESEHLFNWSAVGWKEEPSPIYPMLHFVNMHDKNCSLTLFTQGGKEYEVLADNKLALTLFRCVGWLGKPDLQRRPGIASGQQFKYIATPDSQMQGNIHFDCALLIESEFKPASLQRQWQQYSVKPLYYQNQSLNQFTNTLKYFVMHPLAEKIADSYSGCLIDCPELVVSALKPADDGNGFIIRLYNPGSETVREPGSISLPDSVNSIIETDLLENAVSAICFVKGKVNLKAFAAKQIKTFRCSF
ncbi:glycosyl hydrolase-related protein [Psychromonas aquimarina]|uniref:glycoside hydrolase family 38 N-terminal domain-containing protein n=1 Tax=Psychromonas aquimarina TaxID=444919 RepID=UPI000490B6C8|nr:glycosyl hydrolase-related protein [Psychromonas aquimarina]